MNERCPTLKVKTKLQNQLIWMIFAAMAIPTLVRSLPPPLKRVIGTLSDPGKFLVGLEYDGPKT